MSYTLLLADESVTTHRVVALTFAGQDVRVVSVSDGQQALDRLATERPDIVLADIAVPKVNGYELAAHVLSEPKLRGVPVLLLMGAFDTVDEQRVKESGAAGVLFKPFEPGIVIKRVKELLGFGGDDRPVEPRPIAPPPTGPRPVDRPTGSESPRAELSGDEPRGHAEPVEQRVEGRPMPPPRDAHIPMPPAAWDEVRARSGLAPDITAVAGEAPSDDYSNRLDAAFDSLDAQLAGRSTRRPAVRPTRAAAPTTPAEEPSAEAPVYEVDRDWFNESSAARPPASAAPLRAAPVAPVETEPVAAVPVPRAADVSTAPVHGFEPVEPNAPVTPVDRVTMVPTTHVADAFESLLAAELGDTLHSSAPVIEVSDEVIERIADRVAEHLTEGTLIETVSHIVGAVTERLVREEIARIRSRAEANRKT